MGTKEYILIDKNIISKESVFDFNIFYKIDGHQQVEHYIDNGVPVTEYDIVMLEDDHSLYVDSTEYEKYKIFYELFLSNASTDSCPTELRVSFDDKVYDKAIIALENIFKNPESVENYNTSIEIVNNLVDSVMDNEYDLKLMMSIVACDYATHTHSINVAIYALNLGKKLDLQEESLRDLGQAALLHDIGKSKINPEILNKHGILTPKEFAEMTNHPLLGYKIGQKIGIKNNDVLDGIKYHHEKANGMGYPDGLKRYAIPLFARIIGICDIFDALTCKKSYRASISSFEALKYMKVKMNKELDIKLLDSMIMMLK